jgi:hypothetical protein
MNIDIDKFKTLIKRTTLNYSIVGLHLNFVNSRIKSKLISNQRDIITLTDIPNDVINFQPNDDISFYFTEPQTTVLPHIKHMEGEANLEIFEEKELMVIWQIINGQRVEGKLRWPKPIAVERNIFSKDAKETFEYFKILKLDENVFGLLDVIKDVATRFGKVYITIKNGEFLIEATDKTNSFASGTKVEFGNIDSDLPDISLCFEFKNLSNLLSIIDDSFDMRFSYIQGADGGFIHSVKSDETEQYFLFNREA